MELDNKKLTILIIVLSVIIVCHLGFTIWSYLQLRNKKGHIVTTWSQRTKRTI